MDEPPVFDDDGRVKKRVFELGLRYEAHVLKQLAELYGEALVQKPWIAFKDFWGRGLAQPDGVLLYPDRGVVIEIKLSYKDAAEHKMRNIYGKLAQYIWPRSSWNYVQITKNLRLGLEAELVSLDRYNETDLPEYVVTQWRP